MTMGAPLLSIAMPTRNRAQLFERALTSLLEGTASVAGSVEVTVSDGSDDDATGQVVERLLAEWPGGYRYVHNRPMLALVDNMNRAAELASGEWVMQLDDDDYLLPGAGAAMVAAIRRAGPDEQVLMFGTRIVDADGVMRRQQRFRRERYLEPRAALRRLLRDSSFVREPAMVVRRSALEREGRFDPTVGDVTDTDMWVRLFSRYGVRCLPQSTCAYTIHQAAATTGMWNPGTISALTRVFDRAVAAGVVSERVVRRWQANFFHQFILAGAYRRLRLRRRAEAREVLRLFELPEVRGLGVAPKWLPVRAVFTAATIGRPRG
jgi:glycosyltransferase involved in cell wall biosynthesis